jgi:hypothetical protein
MSLAEYADITDYDAATVTVLNPEQECPVYRLLDDLFDDAAVTVRSATTDDAATPSDAVLVEKGGAASPEFAVSSLSSLREELLVVNSDIYVTGARALDEVETPDAISNLDELPFTVTGYPEEPREKLLLIEISRHIEGMAWQAGEGRLATGFQYLSRVEDERGTRRVYERLESETAVETHVYGVPDAHVSPPATAVHGVDAAEIRQSWFVVYESAHHPHEAAALVAVETDSHTWEGCWTYDPGRVADILDYLDSTYD